KKRHRKRRMATATVVASIAIIGGGVLLNSRPLNLISNLGKKIVKSTALRSSSPSSTATPIKLKVRPDTANDGDSPPATMQPFITQKTTEVRPTKLSAQTDTLESRGNETVGQALKLEGRDTKDPQSVRPRILQWSGTISREREVKIELPGVPGKVEILQA